MILPSEGALIEPQRASDIPPALSVSGVSFRYGERQALDGVEFAVRQGGFTALLGPNGAGKTTLFSLITRLFDAPAGTIRVAGRHVSEAPRAALAQLGVVFQQPTLDLDLSVLQNLRYFAALHGLAPARAAQRIETELTRLDMFERRHEKARNLNGGHRRRVEIARALLHQPKLLVLDEPTVGLDAPSRRAIVEHVHDLSRTQGVGVLWATHLIDEVDAAGDDLVVLHRGRILANGSARHVMAETGCQSVQQVFHTLTGDTTS